MAQGGAQGRPGQGADEDPARPYARAPGRRAQLRFRRGQPRPRRRRGPARGPPLHGLRQPALRRRLPGRDRHPRVRQAHRAGQVPRSGLEAQGDELPAGHLRPGLPPGKPVRRALHDEEVDGRCRGHRPPRALRRRLRALLRRYPRPAPPAADRPQGRRHRRGPGRPDRGRRPGQARTQGDHLRSPSSFGRRPDLRHPRVPAAQGHPRGRSRVLEEARRRGQDELRRREDRDDRRPPGRGIRGLLHRLRARACRTS